MTGSRPSLLSPEARLLVRATSPDPDLQAVEELLEGPLDFERLVFLAAPDRLVPPLWKTLARVPEAKKPPGTDRLRKMAAVVDFGLSGAEEALEQTLAVLVDAGMPVMLLKGSALIQTVYPSVEDRPMGDLDLLLPRDIVEDAWTLLRDAGWRPPFGEAAEFWEDLQHLRPLVNPGQLATPIELHRSIVRPGTFAVDHERLWEESRAVEVGSTTVRVPSAHHHLLHLSIHYAWQNAIGRALARTARDVAFLLHRDPPAWDALREVTVESRADTCVYWTLRLTRTLGVATPPDELLDTLRPPTPRIALNALERVYLRAALGEGYPSLRVGHLCWSAGIRPGASGHGDLRPWQDGERWQELMVQEPPATMGQRLRHHAAHLSEWMAFVRDGLVPKDPL